MKWIHRPLALAVIILLSATIPAVGASPDATFTADTVEVTAGETAEIPVTLSDTDAAVVTIGSEQVNYIATVVVRDGNDDRTVTLRYDTSKAGHGGAFAVADDADTVTVESESEFDSGHLLDAGSYDLAVAPGDNASTSNKTDTGSLAVMDPPETTTETSTPGQYAGHVDDIDNGVIVAPAQNQTITGTLDLSEGTEIVVTARKNGAFLKTDAVTVGEDGQFRASFNFDDVSTDDPEFDIQIRADDEVIEETTGTLKTPPTTTATTSEQALQDETTQETTDSVEDVGMPGFGLVTGILALMATALLALRRN